MCLAPRCLGLPPICPYSLFAPTRQEKSENAPRIDVQLTTRTQLGLILHRISWITLDRITLSDYPRTLQGIALYSNRKPSSNKNSENMGVKWKSQSCVVSVFVLCLLQLQLAAAVRVQTKPRVKGESVKWDYKKKRARTVSLIYTGCFMMR